MQVRRKHGIYIIFFKNGHQLLRPGRKLNACRVEIVGAVGKGITQNVFVHQHNFPFALRTGKVTAQPA